MQDVVAVHVKIAPEGIPSVSTQVAALRNLLLRPAGVAARHFERVLNVSHRLTPLYMRLDSETGHTSTSCRS